MELNKKIIFYILLSFILFSIFSNDNNLELINQLEKKYEEKILDTIKSIYNDKYFTVKIIINPLIKDFSISNRNNYNINISVFIDGNWEFIYGEKNRPVINKDGTRLRKFNFLDESELNKIKQFIMDLIEYKEERKDKVIVQSIQYDRNKEFYNEDSKWKRKMQITAALFSGLIGIILLFTSSTIYRLIAIEIKRRAKLRTEVLERKKDSNKLKKNKY